MSRIPAASTTARTEPPAITPVPWDAGLSITLLAEACTDVTGAVTDDDDRAEAEPPPALDDLGDAVDLDDALLERELVRVNPGQRVLLSELEAGFAGGVGERPDAPVIPEPGAIEDDAFDAGGLRPFGDQPADGLRLVGLGLLRV